MAGSIVIVALNFVFSRTRKGAVNVSYSYSVDRVNHCRQIGTYVGMDTNSQTWPMICDNNLT